MPKGGLAMSTKTVLTKALLTKTLLTKKRITKALLTKFIMALVTLSYVIDVNAATDKQSDWTLEYKNPQTVIYTRPYIVDRARLTISAIDNTRSNKMPKTSGFLEVKSEVKINAPLNSVLPYFQGENGCWQWQLKCKSSVILKKINEHHQVVYTVVNMPWPITDRDFVFEAKVAEHSTASAQGLTKKIVISLAPHPNPELYNKEKSKLVRATSNIVYELTASSGNKTQLNIYMHTDFSGSISPKLINGRLVDSLRDDIDALLQLIDGNSRPSA